MPLAHSGGIFLMPNSSSDAELSALASSRSLSLREGFLPALLLCLMGVADLAAMGREVV